MNPEEDLATLVNDIEGTEEEEMEQLEEVVPESEITTAITESNKSTWLTKLGEVGDNFTFREYNETYYYKRVVDPSGNNEDKFLIFHTSNDLANMKKEDLSSIEWDVHTFLLSKHYVVVNIKKFSEELTKNINVVGTPKIKTYPFVLSAHYDLAREVNMLNDNDAKFIFELITGIDCKDGIDSVSTKLFVNILNSYNGSISLTTDYCATTSIEKDDGVYEFCDYFSLINGSSRVRHFSSNFNEIKSGLESITSELDMIQKALKLYTTDINDTAEKIAAIFGKTSRKRLISYWENVPVDYKNLYYLLIVSSIVLHEDYRVDTHNKIRAIVEKLSSKAINKFKKMNQ